ncbi:RteC domain-containing protein [Salegentibacter sp. F188]|uniref:RteC domain-containing protein n=1 Tax=Autumnicola patrickiae TaxID=3075591 RepID=A0ABU3E4K2_9FLAO|nr:RteC domain-containing protein [Salegentibacter sp. F188]MDT0690922.1 RteC domain-containing protein [Salegentibacter sp. F188]
MDPELLSYNLLKELKEIKFHSKNIVEQSYRSGKICRTLLCTFKREVFANGFDSIEAEIKFFKVIKQIPLVHLVYFTEIHSFEIQFPKADKDCQLKFTKRKINQLNQFFRSNLDFAQYVDSEDSRFDKEYYTRDSMNDYHVPLSDFYFQDPDFCTPKDMLLGQYKGFCSLVNYLDERLFKLQNNLNTRTTISNKSEKIPWPFSNADWVELVYALSAAGLGKQNNMNIIKISQKLQEIFDYEPSKDIYKTFQDLKNRKKSRTQFLDFVTTALLSEMNKSEE